MCWEFAKEMTTTTRQVNGVTIVDISGQIVFGEESTVLRILVCDLLGEGRRTILLNLADVDYVDSTGLGHLVSAVASVRKMQRDLKLLNLRTMSPRRAAGYKAAYHHRHHGRRGGSH
jgi:anti-sigma B factor antagonist